jgi:hypothetical protein
VDHQLQATGAPFKNYLESDFSSYHLTIANKYFFGLPLGEFEIAKFYVIFQVLLFHFK